MSRHDSLVCLGGCCKTFHFRRFKRDCNVILRGRRGTWGHVKLFHNVSKIVLCVTGAILLRRCQKMSCIFCGRRGALETSIVILRGRCSTLDVSC